MTATSIEVPAKTTSRSTGKARQKVEHWFRLKELTRAKEVGGLMVLAYCGRPVMCGRDGAPSVVIDVVGGLMAVNGPEDCKTCVRAHEADLRRVGRRRDRWNEANGF